ncbi:transcription factor atf21 [Podospora fimiseda]|uniref:Transcription factor atf21 n=1 Tax=Podospora fimiseda TaxID=252190 RepID=A0AAN7H270_9PEZI|nr:transcription factor atf21 [Podospora fimiseda]
MDTATHFFSDCLDFDDSNSYQSPDNVAEGALDLHFQPYDTKLDIGVSPTNITVDGGDLEPRSADVWDGFAQHIGAMDTTGQKALFVDPGLYDPETDNEDIKTQIQALSMDMSRPTTRRTSSSKSGSQRTSKSSSASTDITPPDQGPPAKRRKVRKIKKEPNMVEDEHKRNKFLERNRIAASKCREKKKMYVSELEETKIGLETHNAHLQMEYNGLLGEVSGLKHHLMAHAKCNDANIDRWLNNEARRFVQTTNEFFGGTFSFGQSSQPGMTPGPPIPGSPRSRNTSIASTQYQPLSAGGIQFDGLGAGPGASVAGDRHGSMVAYPPGTMTTAGLFDASPTDSSDFVPQPHQQQPCPSVPDSLGESPKMKQEPGINYDHMPDSMFSPDPSAFGGAG